MFFSYSEPRIDWPAFSRPPHGRGKKEVVLLAPGHKDSTGGLGKL
jgi:hypothetical protein